MNFVEVITIIELDNAEVEEILDAEFIFVEDNIYTVVSGDKLAKIVPKSKGYQILTTTPEYFVDYFDLNFN